MTSFLVHVKPSNVALFSVFLVFSYVVIGVIRNHLKLRQFRGPPLAGFSRLWLFWKAIRAQVSKTQFDALEKYGSPCRFGPDLLLTNDPDIIRHMNAPGSKWRRSGWYEAMKFDPRRDSVFSTRDEGLHSQLKSKEVGGYNGRAIDTLETDMDAEIVKLTALIRNSYEGISLDFSQVARFFVLDVLSSVAFGKPFGFMAANEDLWEYSKGISAIAASLELATNHRLVRWLLSFPLVQALTMPKVTDKKGMGPAIAFARKQVAERYGTEPKVRQDMLGHFVNKGLTQEQCEVEAYLQIIAGSDSTTTILTSAMFLLAGTPTAYQSLKDEIDAAAARGDLSSPVAKFAETQKLPYLQACVWEAIRVYPPLFGLKSKLAPPGGETIKGIFFPEGTELGICDDALCRRKDIFGEDSHVFRPDRWVEADPETRVKYQRTMETIFGTGRFQCLGRHIAMMELHKTLLEVRILIPKVGKSRYANKMQLMRNFNWAIADPMRGIDTYSHMVHIRSNVNLIPRSR